MTTPDPLTYEIRRLATQVLRVADRETESPPPPPGELAARIGKTFHLRPIDVDVALVALAAELDDEFRRALNHEGPRTDLGILAAIIPDLEARLAVADAVGRDAPIIQARLVRRVDGAAQLVATRRFRTAISGKPLFSELPDYASLLDAEPMSAPWGTSPLGLLEAMRSSTASTLAIVHGAAGVGKTTWACHSAFAVSGKVLRVDAAKAAAGTGHTSEIRELIEDATMLGRAVVLDNVGQLLRGETRLSTMLEELLDSVPTKLFVVAADAEDVGERVRTRAIGSVHIEPPGPADRRRLWRVDESTDPVITTLADDLILTPRQIANARSLINGGAAPASAAFEQLPRTNKLTLPDRSTAKLEALVLPEDVYKEIVEIVGAIKARGTVLRTLPPGRGHAVTALFDGDSGTGKTFSCEVIAAEVGLPLMRVNVSSLVDKYIGETEKNLSRVFAQAQAQGGILFFDEADALFGTRTDVSRAQDRYANLETNLLLQLMESFSGVVLLTTNLKKNIDQAFMRRIMFKVYFETPEPPERERLWRTLLGPGWFPEGIDFARLATTFELSGGSIRAALLRAAYRAAAANGKIKMSDLVDCAQLEVQGMGRVATW